jgi:hypothetical protein
MLSKRQTLQLRETRQQLCKKMWAQASNWYKKILNRLMRIKVEGSIQGVMWRNGYYKNRWRFQKNMPHDTESYPKNIKKCL